MLRILIWNVIIAGLIFALIAALVRWRQVNWREVLPTVLLALLVSAPLLTVLLRLEAEPRLTGNSGSVYVLLDETLKDITLCVDMHIDLSDPAQIFVSVMKDAGAVATNKELNSTDICSHGVTKLVASEYQRVYVVAVGSARPNRAEESYLEWSSIVAERSEAQVSRMKTPEMLVWRTQGTYATSLNGLTYVRPPSLSASPLYAENDSLLDTCSLKNLSSRDLCLSGPARVRVRILIKSGSPDEAIKENVPVISTSTNQDTGGRDYSWSSSATVQLNSEEVNEEMLGTIHRPSLLLSTAGEREKVASRKQLVTLFLSIGSALFSNGILNLFAESKKKRT